MCTWRCVGVRSLNMSRRSLQDPEPSTPRGADQRAGMKPPRLCTTMVGLRCLAKDAGETHDQLPRRRGRDGRCGSCRRSRGVWRRSGRGAAEDPGAHPHRRHLQPHGLAGGAGQPVARRRAPGRRPHQRRRRPARPPRRAAGARRPDRPRARPATTRQNLAGRKRVGDDRPQRHRPGAGGRAGGGARRHPVRDQRRHLPPAARAGARLALPRLLRRQRAGRGRRRVRRRLARRAARPPSSTTRTWTTRACCSATSPRASRPRAARSSCAPASTPGTTTSPSCWRRRQRRRRRRRRRRAVRAQLLFVAAGPDDAGPLVRELRAAGYRQPIMGGDSFDSPELIQAARQTGGGVYFTTHAAFGLRAQHAGDAQVHGLVPLGLRARPRERVRRPRLRRRQPGRQGDHAGQVRRPREGARRARWRRAASTASPGGLSYAGDSLVPRKAVIGDRRWTAGPKLAAEITPSSCRSPDAGRGGRCTPRRVAQSRPPPKIARKYSSWAIEASAPAT